MLAKNLTPPVDAVTQTFGCIGRKGSGKTYLAGLLAEQMLDHHAQIIVIDPVGNWYGLRVAEDGKGRGKDVFIIGGDHGDVPILPDAGAKIARLLVDRTVSVILDISSFRQGERKRFAADFAEEFFHRKKSQKSAVHLFVEEAQLFAPQRVATDEARMLGAFENIIRLGRNYGIGATMISQRPQSINKEVLSQVECLFVLQVNGTHERKALEAWVQEAGADRALVGQLPGLAQGEGYVWSPSWLRIYDRFHFYKKTTFDASATPKVGQTRKAAMLTPMDVEELRADLQQVIEKADADNPKVLRDKITELERHLALARVSLEIGIKNRGETIDREALLAAQQAEVDRIMIANRQHYQEQFTRMIDHVLQRLRSISETIEGFRVAIDENMRVARETLQHFRGAINDDSTWTPPPLSRTAQKSIKAAVETAAPLPSAHRDKLEAVERNETMNKAQRSILTVLAQRGPSFKSTVAAYAGYSPTVSTMRNALSVCRNMNWMTGDGNGPFEITPIGREVLGPYESLPTGNALLSYWEARLTKAERTMLIALARHPFTSMTKEELALETEIDATVSTFRNALSGLRTLCLIQGSGILQLTKDFAEAITQ